LKEKNNELWRVYYFSVVHLDNNLAHICLADKKTQEKKTDFSIDRQQYNTEQINDDCITTERPAANTRLCTPAG
jgi:hypothetical protein